MSDPKTQDSHISWPRNMHQIGLERAKLIDHAVPIPDQQGVTVEVMIKRERSQTSPQFHRGEGSPAGHLRAIAAVDAKERKVPALSKCGEFPAKCGQPVRFMERIREERDAHRGISAQ